MRALYPIALTSLFLTGYSLGDRLPLLNPYELVRWSGAAFLPEVGTHFIADQAKLGKAALPVGWVCFLLAAFLASAIVARLWYVIK